MAPARDGATETSPLLPKSQQEDGQPAREDVHRVEEEREEEEDHSLTDAEDVVDTAISATGPDGWSEEAARARRYSGPEGWAQDAGATRRFSSTSVGRQKQYEGMPEVRARMKYIFAALATGVS